MMNNRYIFIFAITIFILLSITGSGIFLNDEWVVGQQVNQLSQGHQITYNEGKYGYFMNGTPSNYIELRKNLLFYPIALPLLSLPSNLLFTLILSDMFTRLAIILLWTLLGLYCWCYIKNGIASDISFILLILATIFNTILFSPFLMSGKYIPYEIFSIGFTNILIMGVFSVTAFKLSELLFIDPNKQIVGWIASISCTSLLFWAGTLKDHVLLSTVILLLCYCQIYYFKHNDSKYEIYSYLLAGLSIWIRPEVGIFTILVFVLFKVIYVNRDIIYILNMITWIFIGSIPFFINNYIITGDIIKIPFLVSQSYTSSGAISEHLTNATSYISANYSLNEGGIIGFITNIIKTIFSPTSGSLGIVVPLCLFIFALITIIKYKPKLSTELKFILTIGIGSISYYLLLATTTMQIDGGVMPDIRYFTPAYSLFTLFALSIIPYEINYKKVIRNIFTYLPIIIILSLLTISIIPDIGSTYKTFRILPEMISILTLAIMIVIFINDKTTKPIPIMEKLVSLAIVSPLSWQLIMIFVYHTSKLHSYPMFIPISEFIFKIMFGG